MKKLKRVSITVIIIIVAGVILWFVNSIWGNPISKKIAEQAAKEYIAKNYADQDVQIDSVVYNFKDSEYVARVVSNTSIDTYFAVEISGSGKVEGDTYVSVENGWNTYERLDQAYRECVDSVFENPEFPIDSDIDFGELRLLEKSRGDYDDIEYGIDMATLEKDKQYDIKELAKSAGHIIFYTNDEEVSFQKASELLLQLKTQLEEADVPFYAIDFVLEKPRDNEKPVNADDPRIEVNDFLYSDLYEEGLEARVEEAHNKLSAYYEEQDALLYDTEPYSK